MLETFEDRVNCAVSNVEGLKLKITGHKTFKNKFDRIRAGIKFVATTEYRAIFKVFYLKRLGCSPVAVSV